MRAHRAVGDSAPVLEETRTPSGQRDPDGDGHGTAGQGRMAPITQGARTLPLLGGVREGSSEEETFLWSLEGQGGQ